MRFLSFFLFVPFLSIAQTADIPDEMYFLDTKIYIKNSAKSQIAETVSVLKKNKTYYQAKLDRIDAYFPLIERIFAEEGIPDDFKFLVVQESSLVSDAVSTSNAVGYWQFKRESATELGLRVDHLVDERKSIYSSTRGAAAYFKRSNAVFNNWIYTLQSYQVGLGGTQRTIDSRYYGAKEMDIDGNTYWYVIKCIAHKLAFGDDEGKNSTPPLVLFEYGNANGKTWKDISLELQVQEDKLREYNKWLSHHTIPDDRDYVVIVPASYMEKDAIAAKIGVSALASAKLPTRDLRPLPTPKKINAKAQERYPGDKPVFVLHNGLEAIKAKDGDDINKLAIQAGISRNRFLRFNDLRIFDELLPNEFYYTEAKKNKANVLFHIVKPGETLRDVSQMYGLTILAIRHKNRMKKGEPLQPGRELWLKNKRPKEVAVKIVELPSPNLAKAMPKPIKKDTVSVLPKPTLLATPKQEITPKEAPPVKSTQIDELPVQVATASQFPRISSKDTTHIVQQKETIFSIARLYNTKPDSIKHWNTIDTTGLKIAQVLKVKKKVVEQAEGFKVHVVVPSETLYRLSEIYKIPIQKIQEWNNKSDVTLSAGDIIFIKEK
jgi:membrane-bound lytic murein transglycosylase D